MTKVTQEQLAKLAALVGITPETHPYIWQHTTALDPIEDDWHSLWYLLKGDIKYRLAPYAPALDTPAGDDVFLAPLLRWLRDYYEHWTSWGQCGDDTLCEAGIWYSESKDAAIGKAGNHTLALLRACQSAGVPEICDIFGKGE